PVQLIQTLKRDFWPSLPKTADGKRSLRAFAKRYSEAGAKLRALSKGSKNQWKHITRQDLVTQLRPRLRDPGIIRQNPTGLCGPLAVIVELARRRPAEYVRAITELLEQGILTTTGGKVIKAEQELRDEPIAKMTVFQDQIEEADWILAATMRDDANLSEDVDDDANGIESITLWGAMSDWTEQMIGLKYHWETCFVSGELNAIREAQKAVNDGGIAFLLVDSDLINDGSVDGEDEEEMWWSRRSHFATGIGKFGKKIHCRDDNPPPDHWVLFLGGLQLPSDGTISMLVWSWGGEYQLTGTADSFTEYLYAVVTGRPK
ncbi:MAG TPA: hypothetical protein VNG71_00505, partial [Pyrinomonadaceae bacterium]|nr:hypothetical protein [Pyrinomonadaceae bacterium]